MACAAPRRTVLERQNRQAWESARKAETDIITTKAELRTCAVCARKLVESRAGRH